MSVAIGLSFTAYCPSVFSRRKEHTGWRWSSECGSFTRVSAVVVVRRWCDASVVSWPRTDNIDAVLLRRRVLWRPSWSQLPTCQRVNLYFRSDGDCLITQRERDGRLIGGRQTVGARRPGRAAPCWRRLRPWAIMRGHYVARESHSFSVASRPVMDRWIQLQVIDADVTVVPDTLTSLPLFQLRSDIRRRRSCNIYCCQELKCWTNYMKYTAPVLFCNQLISMYCSENKISENRNTLQLKKVNRIWRQIKL